MKLRDLERQSSTPPTSRDSEADFPLSRLDLDLEQALITEMEMPLLVLTSLTTIDSETPMDTLKSALSLPDPMTPTTRNLRPSSNRPRLMLIPSLPMQEQNLKKLLVSPLHNYRNMLRMPLLSWKKLVCKLLLVRTNSLTDSMRKWIRATSPEDQLFLLRLPSSSDR